ncbi:hypothetical protein Tco_0856209 [Tanacetum coccineum]
MSSFDLEAYSDSDYARANLNRKSTTRGCQFLSRRLISWQCKKQTIMATSTTKAEYVTAANCCRQVLWIQNQMLDYGFNFMNTKIYIDNESTICIVKNPSFHSKTKQIEIRHHFIRDTYEKKLIQVLKIHTDDNVADLLTQAFDVSSYLGSRVQLKRAIDDYALWEIIEEGNSFKPVARTTVNKDGTSTTTIPGPVTDEQKILKKNGLKARSILMITLPSEHLLTFNKHKDAKSLFEAIEARFGGNEATKKTQKTLLKQMYETFNASSSESLDSIFNRLQKIVSQLTILGEIITPEELNLKFLRSLPTEWGMHVVVWRNKSDLGLISFDDLYNNFKIVEPEVKRILVVLSVSTASINNSTACLSDATVYAYLATQPNGSQVVHEDLEQIHEDDNDEMDLKWQLALLSMKARKFYQRTESSEILRVRQWKTNISQDSSRRTVNVEESYSKAMLAIDGTGFDWSYMADEEASTNFALMAFSDSEIAIKKGLVSVEEQLVFYKKNESMLCDQIAVLKRDASFNESDINALKKQVERLKKEKEDNQFKIDNFENASKSLDQLIGNQISDNNKKGLGYNVVPPSLTGLFAPPSIDLSNSRLEKFKQPEFEGYGVKVNKGASENVSKEVKKTSDAPIIEDWVSDCDEDETVVLEYLNVQKPKQADQPRKVSQNPRNNSTSWNTPMPKKMVQKPILNNVKKGTGQREVRSVWTTPTAFLTKSGLVPFSTARQSFSRTTSPVSTARSFNTVVPSVNVVKPRTNAFQKSHSPLRRPFYQQTALKNRNLNNKVNTAKVSSVNTVKGKTMTSTVGEQGINVVKPTAYWAWRPKIKMINHVYKNTGSCISLAIPGQMVTCKESSNPFMAGSLPKTINSNNVDEESQKSERQAQVMISDAEEYLISEDPEYILLGMTEAKDSKVCKITRADGSSSFHRDIQTLLRRLDRHDLSQIYSLVQETFKDHPLEGHDLDLWGDLRMIFDPNEEDDIWSNQQYWELLRWKLHEYSGIYSLFLDGTSIQINMLVEKKYPLKKAILEKMINLKIEAKEDSNMAIELIKFIKSQIAKQS